MHTNNRRWLSDLKASYPDAFSGHIRVLELGSRDINGTPRELFDVDAYIGVDVAEGVGVDVVVAAKDFVPDAPFDVVISLSMLEHDTEWRASLTASRSFLSDTGMLFLAFGAEGNAPHVEDLMPFVEVRAADVCVWIESSGYEIIESFWEEEKYGPDCAGCYNVVAVVRK